MRKQLLTFLKLLLPLIFVSYLCGIALFTHSHVVNGVIIVHSHPFKDAHSHTPKQFETIMYLSSYLMPDVTVSEELVQFFPLFLGLLCFPLVISGSKKREVRLVSLRAPPVCSAHA